MSATFDIDRSTCSVTEGNTPREIAQRVSYGVCDPKGRRMGVNIRTWTLTTVAMPDDFSSGSFYRFAPGTWFAWETHATRDGKEFGALQGSRYCKSYDERSAAIDAFVQRAIKRYVR